MEIKKINPNKDTLADLLEIASFKYCSKKNFDYFKNELKKSYSYCLSSDNIDFTPFGLYENDKLIGHLALIKDKRLSPNEGFFGFMECSNNAQVFTLLWQAVINEAKLQDLQTIKGPINGSIWHLYRCIKETIDEPFFKSEPMGEIYYYNLLKLKNPYEEIEYHSAYRQSYEKIITLLEPAYQSLSDYYVIKSVTKLNLQELSSIGLLAKTVFNSSWGYTNLTDEEFFKLYTDDKINSLVDQVYLLLNSKQQLIGFCLTQKENTKTLIIKTICILPEYQGKGLGNALAYKIHADAKKNGIEKIIYALIRVDNKIKNFPQDNIVIFRKYSSFSFNINL